MELQVKNIFLISAIGLVIFGLFYGMHKYVYAKNEYHRMEANYKAATSSVTSYKDKNNELVFENKELRLTANEFKGSFDSLHLYIRKTYTDMGVNVKKIEKALLIIQKGEGSGIVYLRDTVILKDTLKFGNIQDKFLSLDFMVKGDSLTYSYLYRDTLVHILTKKKRELRDNGTKRTFIEKLISPDWQYILLTKSSNPNAVIENALNIKFENYKGEKR